MKQYTYKNIFQDSIDSCSPVKDANYCSPGFQVSKYPIISSGKCEALTGTKYKLETHITSKSECLDAWKQSGQIDTTIEVKYRDRTDRPKGCFYSVKDNSYYINRKNTQNVECNQDDICICKRNDIEATCNKCRGNSYSTGGPNAKCEVCLLGTKSNPEKTKCFNPEIKVALNELKHITAEQVKQITDVRDTQGKVIKATAMSQNARAHLQREWTENDIIAQYDARQHDKNIQLDYCERQKHADTKKKQHAMIVFPAVSMSDEDDDVNCLNINRDHIVNAYCVFRKTFDETLKEHKVKKTSKDFWPNICCGTIPGDCKARDGIQQIDMVPFAMAQGGNATKENLWGEIDNLLGKTSLVRKGMEKALSTSFPEGASKLDKHLETMFSKINLCGPRVFASPHNTEMQMCQLFHSYHHMFHSFHLRFKELFKGNDLSSMTMKTYANVEHHDSLLETMESALSKRKSASIRSDNLGALMKIKAKRVPTGNVEADDHLVAQNSKFKSKLSNLKSRVSSLESKINSQAESQTPKLKSKLSKLKSRVSILESKINSQAESQNSKLESKLKAQNSKLESKINSQNNQLKAQNSKLESKLKVQNSKLESKINQIKKHEQETCPHLDKSIKFRDQKTLTQMQDEFCTEYNLDLANPTVVNMAMIFLDKDIGRDAAFKRALASTAKFRVTDKCTSPLFKGNDASLQHLNGEWVMIAQLDKESPYLKHEINDKCASRNYLPRTEVGLQMYSDKNQCCQDTKDYFECRKNGCSLTELNHHWVVQPLSFKMTLTGNVFEFELYNFILEGTQYTSPTRTNTLKIGHDVNDGDVKNSQTSGTSLLEVSESDSFDLSGELEAWKAKATGTCFDLGDANDLFRGVTASNGKLRFSCEASPSLCACLTRTGSRTETMVFKTPKGSLMLVGDGEYVSYTISTVSRRRRLLQMRKSGC
jgi:predicted nuclease with TOPRIM domain